MRKCTLVFAAMVIFFALAGCGDKAETNELVIDAAEDIASIESPDTTDNSSENAAEKPHYTLVRPRIAVEDRYLYFENDALIVNGVLYCSADELYLGLSSGNNPIQTLFYKDKEYAPVHAYYESLGLTVIWDAELDLVRVYKNAPEYMSKASKKTVNVLLYHHILSDSENENFHDNGTVVSAEAFEAQMKYLSDNGFTTITLLQLYDFLYNDRELPDKSVLITFDDGYYSNLTRAYHILRKYNQCAVIFAITSLVYPSRDGGFDPGITQYITADDLKAYSDVFEYASHTHALHDYDKKNVTLLAKADILTILDDLDKSFFTVNNNMALAYPLGLYSKSIINALKETPIKLAFTTKSGVVKSSSDPYKLNRHIIWPTISIKAFAKMLK